MPITGLSLVGFLAREQAISYLRTYCAFPDDSDQTLAAVWETARARLRVHPPGAGKANVSPIPSRHESYLSDWIKAWPGAMEAGWQFRMVEVAPLLCTQSHVSTNHSLAYFAQIESSSLEQLLSIFLPLNNPLPKFETKLANQSASITSARLNLHPGRATMMQPNESQSAFLLPLLASPPHVAVTRFDGRCYLGNGFHRVYGAFAKDIAKIPCLFKEGHNFPSQPGLAKIPKDVLESKSPPTFAHFAEELALAVQLKKLKQVINIHWSEESVPDD